MAKRESKEDRDAILVEIGQRLKKLRLEFGYTQNEVANMIGITRSVVSHHESGISDCDIEILRRYADLYGVTMDDICGIEHIEPHKLHKLFFTYAEVDFSDDEISEIQKYINYIISKREV